MLSQKIFLYHEQAKFNLEKNETSNSHSFVKSHDNMTWMFIFILYNVLFCCCCCCSNHTDKWCTLTLSDMNVFWMDGAYCIILYKYLPTLIRALYVRVDLTHQSNTHVTSIRHHVYFCCCCCSCLLNVQTAQCDTKSHSLNITISFIKFCIVWFMHV